MSLSSDDLVSIVEDRGRETVQEIAEQVKERGIDVTTEVVRSASAVDGINRYVDDHGIDAVVMATHGRSGLDRVLLGSVTDKVLRTAHVPVLVVPSDVEAA